MPLGFWNDPDQTKFKATYFERFPNIWHHGDFVELTQHDGLIIYGRSDTVLKPGGVRIGTAEIYRQVEGIEAIEESVVVGQEWDNDVRVVLFVKLRKGYALDKNLEELIKQTIRTHTTPRHVPAKIVAVTDIPKTKNGKIVELAVREVIHHRTVASLHTLSNPESLKLYENLQLLQF
jgi:acetoacetyl-CoA synthetase